MEICFAVPWIESEAGWGRSHYGYKLFLDRDVCIRETKNSSSNNKDDEYYLGPVRPLVYYEVPKECIPQDNMTLFILKEKGFCFTDDSWEPKFKSQAYSIQVQE